MEGDLRGVRGVQAAGGQILQPADGVVEAGDEVAGVVDKQFDGHGVDPEIPPDEIALEGVPEHDLGVTGDTVVGVGAEGGDLHLLAAVRGGDGAEVDARVPHGAGPAPEDVGDDVGAGGSGEVEVVAQAAEDGVADRTADEEEGESAGLELGDEVTDGQTGDGALGLREQGQGGQGVVRVHNQRVYRPRHGNFERLSQRIRSGG